MQQLWVALRDDCPSLEKGSGGGSERAFCLRFPPRDALPACSAPAATPRPGANWARI